MPCWLRAVGRRAPLTWDLASSSSHRAHAAQHEKPDSRHDVSLSWEVKNHGPTAEYIAGRAATWREKNQLVETGLYNDLLLYVANRRHRMTNATFIRSIADPDIRFVLN